MGINCLIIAAIMGVMTRLHPLSEPVELPKRNDIDLTSSPGVKVWGMAIVLATVVLYVIFW